MAFGVDDHCDRQAHHAHGPGEFGFRVAQVFKVRNGGLGEKPFNRDRVVAPSGQGHDRNLGHGGLQPIQRGHFLAAGGAPCGPEVQDHPFAVKLVHRARGVGHVDQGGVWQGGGVGQDHFGHVARHKGRHIGVGWICTKHQGRIKHRKSVSHSSPNRPDHDPIQRHRREHHVGWALCLGPRCHHDGDQRLDRL